MKIAVSIQKASAPIWGNENSNPEIGERFEFVEGEEIKIEVTFEKHLQSKILKALFSNHVYEEIAYEIYELQNVHQNLGLGINWRIGKPDEGSRFPSNGERKNANRRHPSQPIPQTDRFIKLRF